MFYCVYGQMSEIKNYYYYYYYYYYNKKHTIGTNANDDIQLPSSV